MHKSFETVGPISLYVELHAGRLRIEADETSTTVVDVTGEETAGVAVEQRGDQIVIVAPQKFSIFGSTHELDVLVTMPIDSRDYPPSRGRRTSTAGGGSER